MSFSSLPSQLKNQRKVLFISCFAEFGERYGYYILQSLLIFFLIERFGLSEANSSTLVGTVMSVVYMSAIIGGYISDKLINHYVAAFLGSVLMILGSSLLALSINENGLFLGLAFIAISTGLIKSNLASFIGDFYDRSSLSNSHRDFGFSVFYIGINLGVFLSTLFASTLKEKYGFSAAFYSSILFSSLMCIDLIIGFFVLRKYIKPIKLNFTLLLKLGGIIGGYVALVFEALKYPTFANIAIWLALVLSLIIIFRSVQQSDYKRAVKMVVYSGLSILYFSLYAQIFISILLFIDNTVSNQLFSIHINNSQFITILSVFVMLLGAATAKLWLIFEKNGRPISDINKIIVGFVLLSIVFVVFYVASIFGNPQEKISAWFVVFAFLILALSETCVLAMFPSILTKIAPEGFVALYMSVWLVTIGVGGKLAGTLAARINIPHEINIARVNMAHGLLEFIFLSLLGVAICYVFRVWLQKSSH
ncbi:MAG: oligopeptide:H+ symporter [Pseudomonadota bacterium]